MHSLVSNSAQMVLVVTEGQLAAEQGRDRHLPLTWLAMCCAMSSLHGRHKPAEAAAACLRLHALCSTATLQRQHWSKAGI